MKQNTNNLEELMTQVEKIVNFNNIQRSGINVNDIEFIETVKPMIMKKR